MQAKGEDLDQQETEPEAGHGLPGDGDGGDGEVGQAVAPHGAGKACQHADSDGKEEAGAGELQRGAEPAEHGVKGGLAGLKRLAEIAAHQVGEEDQELDRDGLVEVERGARAPRPARGCG